MDIKIFEKPVITKFITIDGEEFELGNLYASLDQIIETQEDNCWGDYGLRDYELYDSETMNKLVKMGLVKNYRGPRMANLYCIKDKKGAEELLYTLCKLECQRDFKE